jgi:hypothetical protein
VEVKIDLPNSQYYRHLPFTAGLERDHVCTRDW